MFIILQMYFSIWQKYFSLRNLTNEFGRLREGLTYDYGKPLLPFNEGHPIDCRLGLVKKFKDKDDVDDDW